MRALFLSGGGLAMVALISLPLAGQGSLSTQGFGYPSGQIGTRARATGGAMAEFDPVSALNPAALGEWTRSSLYIQYEPEYRQVSSATSSDRATIIRFPLFAGAIPIKQGATLALTASTLLDRSWATRSTGQQSFDTLVVNFTDNFQSLGALTDVRLASSYAPHRTLRVGLGVHAITGNNRLSATRVFDGGQVTYAPFIQASQITYTGSAISAGLAWRPTRTFGLAASAKLGRKLDASINDTTIGSGGVPHRVGAGVRFEIATGTEIHARGERVWWSRLTSLSAGGAGAAIGQNSWDFGAGLEGRGPVLFSRPVTLRLGGNRRTLPFLAAGSGVTEVVLAGGFGVPLAFGRASLDVAVQRAARDADIGIKERAMTFSLGLTVRP